MAIDRTRVLIVDDHPIARCGIREMLRDESYIEVVGEASGGIEALTLLLKTPVDLVLLDMVLPGLDGLEVLREVRRRFPATKVLVVSALDNGYAIRDAVKNKADGYLAKQASREEVLAAIQHVISGGFYMQQALMVAFKDGLDAEPQLTDRQREVLRSMASGHSNKEIADQLGVTTETVKSHVTEIIRRLQVRDRTSAVVKALEEKLI